MGFSINYRAADIPRKRFDTHTEKLRYGTHESTCSNGKERE